MKYREIKPSPALAPFIHTYWELKGTEQDHQWERNFPDGCAGVVINLGDTCLTDNGAVAMEFGKTYAVGAMTAFKDSFIDHRTHLLGVCLKPATFTNFYHHAAQHELKDNTIAFERSNSFDIDKMLETPFHYLNYFFSDRIKSKKIQLQSIISDIHASNGQFNISELSKRHYTSPRQLERQFKTQIGISPKEYSNIIRFQKALSIIQHAGERPSLADIAFECGFYDHSHLTNEIKRHTGISPSQL